MKPGFYSGLGISVAMVLASVIWCVPAVAANFDGPGPATLPSITSFPKFDKQEWELHFDAPGPLRAPSRAGMLIKYDIPGEDAVTQIVLNSVFPNTGMTSVAPAKKGDFFLDLTEQGPYMLHRRKTVSDGRMGIFLQYDPQIMFFNSGVTTEVNWVRSDGYPIRGELVGLEAGQYPGAFISVRRAGATDMPLRRSQSSSAVLEATVSTKEGKFQTASLSPGKYLVVVEAWGPGVLNHVVRTEPFWSFVQTGEVTVTADAPPAPLRFEVPARDKDGNLIERK